MIILDLLSFSTTNTAAAATAQAKSIAAAADEMATESHTAAENNLQPLGKVNLGNSLGGPIESLTIHAATTKTAAALSCELVCKCNVRDSELKGSTKRTATNVRQNDGQNGDMGKSVADNDDNNANSGVGADGGGFGSCDSDQIEMVECAVEETCEWQSASQIAGTAAFAECDAASAERAEVVGMGRQRCPEQQPKAPKSLTTLTVAATTSTAAATLPPAFGWLESHFSFAEHQRRQQQIEWESGRVVVAPARARARARTFGENDKKNNADNVQNNGDSSGNGEGSSSNRESGNQRKAIGIAANAKTKTNLKAAPPSIQAGINISTGKEISPRSQSTTLATTTTVRAVSGTKDSTLVALPTTPTERTTTALGAYRQAEAETANRDERAEVAARRWVASSFQLATSKYEYLAKCLTQPADEDVDVAVQPAAEEKFSNNLKNCKTTPNYQPNECGANSRAVWPSENESCAENLGLNEVITYTNANVNATADGYGDSCFLYNYNECCSCEVAKSVIGVGDSAIGTVGTVSFQVESNKKDEKFEGPSLPGQSFLSVYAYCPQKHQWRGRWNDERKKFANSSDKDEKKEKTEPAEVVQKESETQEIVIAARGVEEGAAGQFSLLSTRRTDNCHSENRNQSERLLLALVAGQRTIAAARGRNRIRNRERGHNFHIHSTNLQNQRIHNLHKLTNFILVTSARRPENLLIQIDNELVHYVNEHIYLSDKRWPIRILVGLENTQQAARAIATVSTQSCANCTASPDEVVQADLQKRGVCENSNRVINGSAKENVIDIVNGNAGGPVKQTAAYDHNEEEEKRAEAGGGSAEVRWKAETESASNECDKLPERGGFNDVAATAEYRRVHNSSKPTVILSESRDSDGENTVQFAVRAVQTGEVAGSAYEWGKAVGAKQNQKRDYEHIGDQRTQTQKQQQQLLSSQKAILDDDSSSIGAPAAFAQASGANTGLDPTNASWNRNSNASANANANDCSHATNEEFEASQRLQRLQQHFRGLVCMPRSHLKFEQSPNNNYSGAETSLTHANARQTATAAKEKIQQDIQCGSAVKRTPVEDTNKRTHERSPLFSAATATTTNKTLTAATTTAASSAIQLSTASREVHGWNEYRAEEGSESAEKGTAAAAAECKGECALFATEPATVAPPPPHPTATAATTTAGQQSYVTENVLRLSHCTATSQALKVTTVAATALTTTTKPAREVISCKQSDVNVVGCALQESSDLSLTTATTTTLSTTTKTTAATTIKPSAVDTRIVAVATLTHCTQALQHIANAKQIARNTPVGIERVATPTTPPPPPLPPPLQLPSRLSAFVATKPLKSQRVLIPHERQQHKASSANFTHYHPLHGVSLGDSFTEFDVRQLSELIALPVPACSGVSSARFDCNHNLLAGSKCDSRTIAFECYDELLEEVGSTGSDSGSACHCDNCERALVSEAVTDRNNVSSTSAADIVAAPQTPPAAHNSASSSVRDLRLSGATLYAPNPKNNNPNTEEESQKVVGKMREVNGQLRGLLKKPNRPPPARKNRVVFDETRNEFFEADYIILIREDCAYDEEDEEPCTCGEHELVRLCCEEGCQCNYSSASDETRTPQSPKYAPPIEFVDEAALSPPDGYKDNGLKNTLGGALSGHIFGAQHIQQLQVIQRLQQQRAAMLAARSTSQIPPPPPPVGSAALSQHHQQQQHHAAAGNTAVQQSHSPDEDPLGVCTECAECAECAAKQLQDAECTSPQCQEELAPLGVPAVALVPLHTSSPERRITQKEIIAGEERPKYVLQSTQYNPSPAKDIKDKLSSVPKSKRFVVETITTMTTVTERRIVREAMEDIAAAPAAGSAGAGDAVPPALPAKPGAAHHQQQQQPTGVAADDYDEQKPPPIPPKETSPTQISGILKGGKLWKQDSMSQSDDQNNTTSEDEGGTTKRSVRFVTEDASGGERDGEGPTSGDADDSENQINELIPIKKHSTLFNNALRPNSAVRQLFPSVAHQAPVLTSEALRAFDESKRAGCLVPHLPGSGDTDTIRRSIERNILRRSLIKKKAVKSDISLEERIKQLTCDIDEVNEDNVQENADDENNSKSSETGVELAHRGSPMGEENPQKFANGNGDKSFSPSSSVSSSSSGSSAYKKISDIFNRDKKQDKILEMEENPIVIIPQECRCPAAPDLGMGIQVPVVHTQIHRTPPRQAEPKRQFLSTLAPLTACVAGNKDDLSSYYTLAAAHHSSHAASNAQFAEFNMSNMGEQSGVAQSGDEIRKVAPDVIAGTPGQEQQDELAAFAQQEANRTEKIKKRYTNENSNANASSDDDEQNDYGFNKRPSVRGIKPKFSSTNEILQQMQEQLNQQMPSVAAGQPLNQAIKSYTLPKQSSTSSMTKQISQNPSPQNVPHPMVAAQQQQQQQQQMSNQQALQMPPNAIAQQQTEQRSWSFYAEGADQQQLPAIESGLPQTYYQTLPAGAMFRQTMIQHGQDEASLMYAAQNCQSVTAIEQQHYGHYARSPTRRPESPPPLRNYHQTMVLIPYNAETYSQFAATNIDPKMAHIQRQNILEYQQVTQQTIRVPIGYALPGMQLHVVAGRGHATQYATHTQAAPHPHQRIMAQRYQFAQDGNIPGFSERGVPEGAAAVSHTDCNMVSPTGGGQQSAASAAAVQQQQQMQQQQPQQVPLNPTSQAAAGMQTTQGSVYYAMNV